MVDIDRRFCLEQELEHGAVEENESLVVIQVLFIARSVDVLSPEIFGTIYKVNAAFAQFAPVDIRFNFFSSHRDLQSPHDSLHRAGRPFYNGFFHGASPVEKS